VAALQNHLDVAAAQGLYEVLMEIGGFFRSFSSMKNGGKPP
jgi:hypothetical protein